MTPHIEARARRSDPITSHHAADAITPSLSEIQRDVMRYAAARGPDGFTDLELEESFGDHGATYRTRRAELVELRMIRDSGRRVRLEGDRRKRIVWVIR